MAELFGKGIPLIISHLEPTQTELIATVAANGIDLTGSFADYVAGPRRSGDDMAAVQVADERFRAATSRS